MKSFWDQRYEQKKFAYGIAPIDFLKETLSDLAPGKMLLPGDGEGRNAVYAATLGWDVQSFDFSIEAQRKALALAASQNVTIAYSLSDYQSYRPTINHYDLVGLFYTHMESEDRKRFHKRMIGGLKSGGKIVLQVFSKNQLGRNSGGPKHLSLYHSIEELSEDFSGLKIDMLKELELELDEGEFHQGLGSVLQMIATKI